MLDKALSVIDRLIGGNVIPFAAAGMLLHSLGLTWGELLLASIVVARVIVGPSKGHRQ